MGDIRDLIDGSSVGTEARVRAGHLPRTAAGRLDLTAIKRAFAGTWVETLADAAYAQGYADGADSREGDE